MTGQLTYCKNCITKSLTKVRSGYKKEEWEEAATQNFRNILVTMGDKPAQGCLRFAATDAVIDLASTEFSLRAEVYLQVLKQLVKNPSPRSEKLGYELLHSLCLQSPPTGEVAEFVRNFLRAQKGSDFEDAEFDMNAMQRQGMAKACLTVLDTGDVAPGMAKTRGGFLSRQGSGGFGRSDRKTVVMDISAMGGGPDVVGVPGTDFSAEKRGSTLGVPTDTIPGRAGARPRMTVISPEKGAASPEVEELREEVKRQAAQIQQLTEENAKLIAENKHLRG